MKNQESRTLPDYKNAQSGLFDHILAYLLGFFIGFIILYLFYKLIVISIIGGMIFGAINIFLAAEKSIKKRVHTLRLQFFDLLEAMSVALRAGNPLIKALQSAREDLSLIYPDDTDILVEIDIAIGKFNNAVPMSVALTDIAERSGLEDIAGFASVYATIEGKSGNTDEIIRQSQQIIADKMETEMEIDTLMTAAKTEVNIMQFMPLVILGVIGYAGAGFMDAIYTTVIGRVVSTFGLIVFIISYIIARKLSNVKL